MSVENQQIGPYLIQRLLGFGSLGEVYLVEDPRYNQAKVLKLLRGSILLSPREARARALEAQAIIALSHPYLLPLLDYSETIVAGAQIPYAVMPFCPAGSLAALLAQNNASLLAPAFAAPMLYQAAEVVYYLHEHGSVHQDVKPASFFIRSRAAGAPPDLLLGDVGIAQLAWDGAAQPGQSAHGTPSLRRPSSGAATRCRRPISTRSPTRPTSC